MAYIQKQRGKYRARFSDPLGNVQSRTFSRKADAERFLRQIDADQLRGQWVDPRNADMPLAAWADEFLSLCRRLSPTTQETYRRDLDKYVLPRFGAYRLGQLPADEIENWLKRRDRRWHRSVVGSPSLPNPSPHAAGRRPEADDLDQSMRAS
ncbi:MAG: hypothetical protein ABI706_02905 [Ilumatobacteraceae bacterium]